MIILDSVYFPCISYCHLLIKNQIGLIEQHEGFRKMSFRNRSIIVGSNGLINLTIPVEGGRNNRLPMKDVRICYSENWVSQHWRGIVSSYSKSPFFEHYQSDIEQLIRKKHIFLFDKNVEIIYWLKKVLKLSVTIQLSNEFNTLKRDDIFDYRNKLLPNNYLEMGNYLSNYFQMFEEKHGFQKNLSIIDLLFCEGNNARLLLTELDLPILS